LERKFEWLVENVPARGTKRSVIQHEAVLFESVGSASLQDGETLCRKPASADMSDDVDQKRQEVALRRTSTLLGIE
jgi:hypothetical protein